ncbi:MAG: class I SAM-dependent methyltransferase, partial [archaeon]
HDKEHLLKIFLETVIDKNVETVLDIGAGNGAISIPLSTHVKTLIAVERIPRFVQKLREAGLTTIEGIFPLVNVKGKFDLVLLSWSLNTSPEGFESFIKKAWEKVAPGGVLLIITYDDGGEWSHFMRELGLPLVDPNRLPFSILMEYFHTLGRVQHVSYEIPANAPSAEELVHAFAFVASGGNMILKEAFLARKEEAVALLNGRYSSRDGFSFPFRHEVIRIVKE